MNIGDFVVITQPGHGSRHKHAHIVGTGHGGSKGKIYFVQLASGTTFPISATGIKKISK